MDPKKVVDVLNWKAPKYVCGIKSFLGMVRYYRRFIEDFSKIPRPVTTLLEKKTMFKWTQKCQDAI